MWGTSVRLWKGLSVPFDSTSVPHGTGKATVRLVDYPSHSQMPSNDDLATSKVQCQGASPPPPTSTHLHLPSGTPLPGHSGVHIRRLLTWWIRADCWQRSGEAAWGDSHGFFYWINRGYNLEGGKEKSRRFRILSWTCCQESKCPGLWRGNGGKTKIDWQFESKNMYVKTGVVSPLFAAALWKHQNLHVFGRGQKNQAVSQFTLAVGLSPRTMTLFCYFFSYFYICTMILSLFML